MVRDVDRSRIYVSACGIVWRSGSGVDWVVIGHTNPPIRNDVESQPGGHYDRMRQHYKKGRYAYFLHWSDGEVPYGHNSLYLVKELKP